MLGATWPQKHLLQEDLIEDCLRDQGLLVQTMPANQELLFRRDAFLGPMGAWVEGIKGACSSAQMSLLQHFSSSPGVCVVGSVPIAPNPQEQLELDGELSRSQATRKDIKGLLEFKEEKMKT